MQPLGLATIGGLLPLGVTSFGEQKPLNILVQILCVLHQATRMDGANSKDIAL